MVNVIYLVAYNNPYKAVVLIDDQSVHLFNFVPFPHVTNTHYNYSYFINKVKIAFCFERSGGKVSTFRPGVESFHFTAVYRGEKYELAVQVCKIRIPSAKSVQSEYFSA